VHTRDKNELQNLRTLLASAMQFWRFVDECPVEELNLRNSGLMILFSGGDRVYMELRYSTLDRGRWNKIAIGGISAINGRGAHGY